MNITQLHTCSTSVYDEHCLHTHLLVVKDDVTSTMHSMVGSAMALCHLLPASYRSSSSSQLTLQ